ncbi:MAG: glycosyltransferase family 2 protein [Saprospiraceae bacterium]
MSKVYVVIPAKNEASRIGMVIYHTRLQGFENIIVVDDGSTDATSSIALRFGATVLYHQINLGAGAATQTGIEYALEQGADTIVTLDGDNQHFPEDIPRLLETLEKEQVDVVIGSRFLQENEAIPGIRRFYNKIGNMLTALITGILISDSQSGMKAFRAGFAKKINFSFNGYEFCTEFIYFLRHYHATYREVPINVRYNRETLEKGQSFGNGVKMALRFFKHFM